MKASGKLPMAAMEAPMTDPGITQYTQGPIDVAFFCKSPFGPRTYVVSIVRPPYSKVLATGTFTIE